MKTTLAQINRLIGSIDSAKPEKARLEGERKIILQNFYSEFGIKSSKEGQALLKKLKADLISKEENVRDRFGKLKEKYQW